jgi:hypothetical protein
LRHGVGFLQNENIKKVNSNIHIIDMGYVQVQFIAENVLCNGGVQLLIFAENL